MATKKRGARGRAGRFVEVSPWLEGLNAELRKAARKSAPEVAGQARGKRKPYSNQYQPPRDTRGRFLRQHLEGETALSGAPRPGSARQRARQAQAELALATGAIPEPDTVERYKAQGVSALRIGSYKYGWRFADLSGEADVRELLRGLGHLATERPDMQLQTAWVLVGIVDGKEQRRPDNVRHPNESLRSLADVGARYASLLKDADEIWWLTYAYTNQPLNKSAEGALWESETEEGSSVLLHRRKSQKPNKARTSPKKKATKRSGAHSTSKRGAGTSKKDKPTKPSTRSVVRSSGARDGEGRKPTSTTRKPRKRTR